MLFKFSFSCFGNFSYFFLPSIFLSTVYVRTRLLIYPVKEAKIIIGPAPVIISHVLLDITLSEIL